MKTTTSLTIDVEVMRTLDAKRGQLPRSVVIEQLLREKYGDEIN